MSINRLWSNCPKETIEYVDNLFGKHFGYSIGSYAPRAIIYDNIIG